MFSKKNVKKVEEDPKPRPKVLQRSNFEQL